MTDSSRRDTRDFPEAVVGKKPRLSVQFVWLVPLVALIIGVTLLFNAWRERGRTITITFASGEGLVAGKTKIKYKDVEVGEVKDLTIAPDRSHVVVTARINRQARDFLVEDTRFWVVRARITGGNVTGLATLMEGSYIGLDAGRSKTRKRSFLGLEVPPVVAIDVPGTRFVLRSADLGSLNTGSPLFYRRLQVGQVVGYELDREGQGVRITIFINAPYDRYVRKNSLFWHASGIDVSFDAGGLKINTESIASVLLGGVAFQSPDEGSASSRAAESDTFTLFATKEVAMRHAATARPFVLVFTEPVRGLTVGAPVEFSGVNVGEVTSISLDVSPGTKKVAIAVEVHLYPARFTRRELRRPEEGTTLLGELINRGLYARLKTGNLLTGQRFVSLEFNPPSVKPRRSGGETLPELPVVQGGGGDLQGSLERILAKVEKMPLEELVKEVRRTVGSLDRSLKSTDRLLSRLDREVVPEVRETLAGARKTLRDAGEVLGADSPVKTDLQETLRELTRTLRAVRVLADYLERHPDSLIRGKKGEGE